MIPQSYIFSRPQNAIQGQFYRPGQSDWAVLCSRDGASTILIYPAGKVRAVEELAREKDQLHIETTQEGAAILGFLRLIRPIGEEWIVSHYDAYGGPKPPPIDHQGIDDAYVEHASVVRYWHNGQWLELTGAD